MSHADYTIFYNGLNLPIHGAGRHDATVEALVNKGAILGYAPLDAAALLPLLNTPIHGISKHDATTRMDLEVIPTIPQLICQGLNNAQLGTIGRVLLTPFQVPRTVTLRAVGFICTTLSAGTTARLGIYNSLNNIPDGQSLVVDIGTVSMANVGRVELATNQQLNKGQYFLALETENAVQAFTRCATVAYAITIMPTKWFGCYYDLGAYGVLSNPCPVTTASGIAAHQSYVVVASVDD